MSSQLHAIAVGCQPRVVQVVNRGVTIHYQYDAVDRRTGKEVDRNSDGIIDERTVWIWDGQQVVLQQIDADGDAGPADFEATNRYLYGASVDQLMSVRLSPFVR